VKDIESKKLFEQAKELIPGGVNSPVRAFKSVGRDPIFIHRAKGSKIYDVDGNEYIDYVGSWGPMILGHAPEDLINTLRTAIANGTSFGAPTPVEVAMARKVLDAYPSMDKVRMVNSGTEATMSAIRVARGFTKRDKIIKFIGCYHGHVDYLLVQAGSGVTTLGLPDSPGVTVGTAEDTISLPFNDLSAVEETLNTRGEDIAAIILEPVAGNMGCVPPAPGFLEGLRRVTKEHGVVLIFDEVMTGFRVAYGGAQERFGIDPDMTCLGKIIGGGLPVGAFGGKAEIMDNVAPSGPIYQAGTLSGNPLAMTAGLVTLQALSEPGVYEQLEARSARLEKGLKEAAAAAGLNLTFNRVGSMSTVFFTDQAVVDFDTAKTSDTERFSKFFVSMLQSGVNLAPSQFEAGFISLAHSDEDIDRTVEAASLAFREI
jgi:glutamate-1-semialdehyde 2,1-aminomutase